MFKPLGSRLLKIVAVLALITALMPGLTYQGGNVTTAAERDFLQANPRNFPGRTDVTLGWPGSPLIHYYRENGLHTKDGRIGTGFSTGLAINLISWSCGALILGIVLLVVAGRMTPRAASAG